MEVDDLQSKVVKIASEDTHVGVLVWLERFF